MLAIGMVTSADCALADLSLLDRIGQRDASAVGDLYDRHAGVLYGVICRIVRDAGDAEDILQEVMLRVWQRGDTYEPALGSPRAWLVRIARNKAIDRIRARQARPATQPGDELLTGVPVDEETSPGPERTTLRSEEQRAVAVALSSLPSEQRLLIEEAYFLGLTQSELAVKFELPLGTVKTRIRTGMISMRDHLRHLM